jgi:hypothetical protein
MDIDTGGFLSHFNAPGNLSNPVIFSNNSFLAGINSDGLLLVDATSGAIFDIMEKISLNALLYPFEDKLYCLRAQGFCTVFPLTVTVNLLYFRKRP